MSEYRTPEDEILGQLPAYLAEEARRLDAIDAANQESDLHYLDEPGMKISFTPGRPHPARRGLIIAAALLTLLSVPVVAVKRDDITALFTRCQGTSVGNAPSRKPLLTERCLRSESGKRPPLSEASMNILPATLGYVVLHNRCID